MAIKTKKELQAELTSLGIAFDDSATKEELAALLPAEAPAEAEAVTPAVANDVALKVLHGSNLPSGNVDAPDADSHDEIEVSDPLLLRPTELPLVIKPANGGEWNNEEQAAYAKTLNAAAYSNPTRWNEVKNVEIARLKEIGVTPDRYYFYTGTVKGENNLSYKNKLID